MNKEINMEYPYDIVGENRLYDGKIHRIVPSEVKKINNLYDGNFYVMRYYDIDYDVIAITLLKKSEKGEGYEKIPLDDYQPLLDFLDKYGNTDALTDVPVPTQDIGLGSVYRASVFFKENKYKTQTATLSAPPDDPPKNHINSKSLKYQSNMQLPPDPSTPIDAVNQENKKRIMLMYPYDITRKNNWFDGQKHEISPDNVWRINVLPGEFFIMEYYDLKKFGNMRVLLTKIDGKYYHVPLDNYEIFENFFYENIGNFDVLTPSHLPEEDIELSENLESEYLFSELVSEVQQSSIVKYRSPVLKFKKYMFYNKVNDYINLSGGIFSNLEQFDPDTFEMKHFFRRDYGLLWLNSRVSQYINGSDDVQSVRIRTNFSRKNDTFSSYYINSDGDICLLRQTRIPGIHEYNVTYSNCPDNRLYEKINNTEGIEAASSEDVLKTFSDIGMGKVDSIFYDKLGRPRKISGKKDDDKRF